MAYNIVHQKGDRRSCISNVKNNGVHQSAFEGQITWKELLTNKLLVAAILGADRVVTIFGEIRN